MLPLRGEPLFVLHTKYIKTPQRRTWFSRNQPAAGPKIEDANYKIRVEGSQFGS